VGEKACFVIAPIGLPDSDTKRRSDQVLKHIIKPAVKICGYTATRADEMSEPGLITSQVIQRIVDDPLVVADLTESNPNVFYEMALRHAVKKPLVQLIAKGERIPFDVANMRTIILDHRDLDSVEAAKQEMIAQIKVMELPGAIINTPISVSLDLQTLQHSDKPQDRSLADLVSAITDLRRDVFNITRQLDDISAYAVPRVPSQWINPPTDRLEDAEITGTGKLIEQIRTLSDEEVDALLREDLPRTAVTILKIEQAKRRVRGHSASSPSDSSTANPISQGE
jgi:hypothetical protein